MTVMTDMRIRGIDKPWWFIKGLFSVHLVSIIRARGDVLEAWRLASRLFDYQYNTTIAWVQHKLDLWLAQKAWNVQIVLFRAPAHRYAVSAAQARLNSGFSLLSFVSLSLNVL